MQFCWPLLGSRKYSETTQFGQWWLHLEYGNLTFLGRIEWLLQWHPRLMTTCYKPSCNLSCSAHGWSMISTSQGYCAYCTCRHENIESDVFPVAVSQFAEALMSVIWLFLVGYLKDKGYANRPQTINALKAAISTEMVRIRSNSMYCKLRTPFGRYNLL